jgi:hypothetical protein
MVCTCVTVLIRLTRQSGSGSPADQTKSLQRPENNVVAKTYWCSMTPHYPYKSVHCTDAKLDTRACSFGPLNPLLCLGHDNISFLRFSGTG